MREMFARDLTEATRNDAAHWARRPRWHRAIEFGASWLAPNLQGRPGFQDPGLAGYVRTA